MFLDSMAIEMITSCVALPARFTDVRAFDNPVHLGVGWVFTTDMSLHETSILVAHLAHRALLGKLSLASFSSVPMVSRYSLDEKRTYALGRGGGVC